MFWCKQERNLRQRLVLYINGKIKIEPCIGTFNKLQSEPLKAARQLYPTLLSQVFKHSGQNLTIQKKDSIDHMVWVALGHLYGCYSGQFLETSTCGWRWSLGFMSGLWTSTTASAGTIWHHCTTTARRS